MKQQTPGWKMEIENLGRLPRSVVDELTALLASLTGPADDRAHRDPARRGFFILRGELRAFYVAVTPSAGKLLLLASWPARTSDTLDCAAD